MPQLIGALLVFFIGLLLIMWVLGAFLFSIPAWGLSLVGIYLSAYIIISFYVNKILHSTPKEVVNVMLNQNKIVCCVNKSAVGEYASVYPIFLPIVVSIGWSWYYLNSNKETFLSDVDWILAYPIAYLICIIIISVVSKHSISLIPKKVVSKIQNRLDNETMHFEYNISRLVETQNEINNLSSELNISFKDYLHQLESDLSRYLQNLKKNSGKIALLVKSLTSEAENDYVNLNQMADYYYTILQQYKQTSRNIISTGSRSLISEMDNLNLQLTSQHILQYLSSKEWGKFKKLLQSIEAHLNDLANITKNYTPDSVAELSDVSKALEIFNLKKPYSVSDVKKAYRKIAMEYHPDKAEQTTPSIRKMAEEKSKEINWAKDILMNSLKN